ncbi:MAG: sensor histidine kinase [Rhizobiaceae bacterium]
MAEVQRDNEPDAAGDARLPVRRVLALIVALFVLCGLVLAYTAWLGWREAGHRAVDRATAASQVVATNTSWIVELSQQALRRIDEALGPNPSAGPSGTVRNIREAVDSLPGIVKAYVVLADGTTIYSTDPQLQPIDIRDRDYFAELAAGKTVYISSLLVSRLNGEQIFVVSRRLERNGQFVGAAIVSFDVVLLRDIWQSLGLDEGSTVSMVRDDGWLVARYPFAAGPLDMRNYELFVEHLANNDFGTYDAISPADGVARIVGYRRVPGTNLIAVASVSSQAAYASFWRTTGSMLLVAALTAAALAAAAIWIGRLLQRDARRQELLVQTLETNRLLFRDIHHRVKNNLQSVQSLIRMQPIADGVKRDLQGRIAAMTAVHEHIYRLDRYAEVSAQSLLPAIVDAQVRSFGVPVKLSFDIDPVEIDRDHATPLALLLNELVTNALKYAFRDGRAGAISVSLKSISDTRCAFTVADNGIGFDTSVASQGMGRRLIVAMVSQLQGTHAYVSDDNGTRFEAEIMVRGSVEILPRVNLPTAA